MPWNDKNWGVIGATAFGQSFNMVQTDAPITDLHKQKKWLILLWKELYSIWSQSLWALMRL
jgi:hypothetical protein